MTIPTLVFIVPYRNRKTQKFFFCKHMEYILENENYEIYFSHQADDRPFNRGAVKNIGFFRSTHKFDREINNDFEDISWPLIHPVENKKDLKVDKNLERKIFLAQISYRERFLRLLDLLKNE